MSETSEQVRTWIPCGAICPHPPILLPGVGRGREHGADATHEGMVRVAAAVAAQRPEVLLCITPHGPAYRGALCVQDADMLSGSMEAFGAPALRMDLPVDRELTDAVCRHLEQARIPVIRMSPAAPLDHGCIVPLYFLRQAWPSFRIVHVTAGFFSTHDHVRAGAAMRAAVEEIGANALFLASADLSHVLREDGPYGFHAAGPDFDRDVEEILRSGALTRLADMDPDKVEQAAQCGLRPMCTLAGYLCGDDPAASRLADVEIFSHEGPFGVGYLTAYAASKENPA